MNELKKNKPIYIIGAGGLAKEVLGLVCDIFPESDLSKLIKFVVPPGEETAHKILGFEVISETEIEKHKPQALIAIGDPDKRKKIFLNLHDKVTFPSVIHPKACVSRWVELSEGCIVTAGAVLTSNIKVGAHSHFHVNSTVGHDCIIGSFVTSSPGAIISGNCLIGDCVNLGANSTVKQGIKITSNITVGMGAAVIRNIETPGVYAGIPAKRIHEL